MTEEQKQKFREFFPEYTVKDSEICLSPYIDIFEAGIELATKDLVCEVGAKEEVIELQQKELEIQRHNADVRCDQAIESIKQLSKAKEQIEKMKNTRNCLTFYNFKCPLQEQSDNKNKPKSCKGCDKWELAEN